MAAPGFESGTLWVEGRDLTTAPTTPPLIDQIIQQTILIFLSCTRIVSMSSKKDQRASGVTAKTETENLAFNQVIRKENIEIFYKR